MTQETYLWERPFRLRILAACLQQEWFARIGTQVIRPYHFDTAEEQALTKFIIRFYTNYHRAPAKDEMLAEFPADDLMHDLVCDITGITDDLAYAKEQAIKFAKTQATRSALMEMTKLIDQGKFDECVKVIANAAKVGDDVSDLGIDLIEDIDKWMYHEYDTSDRINTGIYHLDQALHGGLGRGEYGLLLAPTNGGKTTTLINIGFGAASLMSGADVLHVAVNEMSAKDIAENYACRVTGIPYTNDVDLAQYLDTFDNSIVLRVRGRIRIKDFARLSTEQLSAYLDSLEFINFRPDILVVDYADLLTIDPRREYRLELGRIARELRAMAKERNMAVWSASQVQRNANRKELIGLDAISESYDKATVADVILSINMSKEEKDQGISRLYCDKTRVKRTKSGWIVQCSHNLESYALESTRYMTYSEWLDEKSDNGNKQLQITK